MEKTNLIVLSEDGSYLTEEAVNLVVKIVSAQIEVVNAPQMNHVMMKVAREIGKPVKNAHNNPSYLLSVIEESEYPVIVVAWDENEEGFPKPRFLVGQDEIQAFVAELDKNRDTDAWATAVRVNKEIRTQEQ